MVGMGQPRTAAWAGRQIAKSATPAFPDGRPTRLAHITLVHGFEEDAWKAWSQEDREAALLPFVGEGERIHWSNDGEGFIVDERLGGQGAGTAASSKSLEQLQEQARVNRLFAQARQSGMREGYQQGYAAATVDFASLYVQLEERVIEKALAPDATEADRRLGLKAMTNWQDRMMGKPVAAVEDVTQRVTPARQLMRSGKARVLPASAGWKVEDVAEQSRRELEAGSIEVDDA